MSKYWSKRIAGLGTYEPGEQPKDQRYIKLNTNENPYPPSPKVLRAIKKAANADLRLYPDPACTELRETIAQYYRIDPDEIFIGNGSDEVLAFSFAAFFNPENPILFPDITYSFYPVYADFFNIKYQTAELNEDFSIPIENFLTANGGTILPNPNAPTSKYLSIAQITKIIEFNLSIDKIVIIDEAYIDFAEKSAVEFIKTYPNLLIIQTLSKSRSLAGMRIGFAMGQKELIEGLERVKGSINSYTVNRLAIAAAAEAFRDDHYFQFTREKIVQTRAWVTKELRAIGFKVMDSQSNFLFISHERIHAGDLYRKLREKGVLVRYFKLPRIDNYLRVSIGSDPDMRAFLKIVTQILEN